MYAFGMIAGPGLVPLVLTLFLTVMWIRAIVRRARNRRKAE